MLDWIIDILLWIMNMTHKVTHLWAVDIILLTILARVALYPLNKTMNKSMKQMQKLQPVMKEIQEKYKDQPEKSQQEMMALYKKYKINPLASCFPLLLQMPIFIALFWALRDPRFFLRLPGFEYATLFGIQLTVPPLISHPFPEIALKAGVFDLFSILQFPLIADRFLYLYTLPLVALYIATTIIQSKMMSAQSQAQTAGQPNTMLFMMPMFIIFGFMFPTGLLVYFITSNALQMGQYWQIQREVTLEEGLTEDYSLKDKSGPSLSNKTAIPEKVEETGKPNKGKPDKGKKNKK
jgi:YidC/Oxa1 family membrane protein insertase